jgi:hypothetical protein
MQCRLQKESGLEKSKIRLKDQSHAVIGNEVPIPCNEMKELVTPWQTQTFLRRKE